MKADGTVATTSRIGVVGYYIPRQIVFAAEATPVQLHGSWSGTYSTEATRLLGAVDAVVPRILTDLLDHRPGDLDGLVICNDSAAHLRLFYVARMLSQRGRLPYPVMLLDCPSDITQARHRFVTQQYMRLAESLGNITGAAPSQQSLKEAGEREIFVGEALKAFQLERVKGSYTGAEALTTYIRVSQASQEEALNILAGMKPFRNVDGLRLFMTGSHHPDPSVYQALDREGIYVVGEDHPTGDGAWVGQAALGDTASSIYEELATLHFSRSPLAARSFSSQRAQYLYSRLSKTTATQVVGLVRELDDAPMWETASQQRLMEKLRIPFHVLRGVSTDGLDEALTTIQERVRKGVQPHGTA